MRKFIYTLLIIGFLGGLSGAVWVLYLFKTLPSPELIESRLVAESTRIYDRTGEVLLYEIHGEEKRTVIPFDEIPLFIKQATLAIEDENFYTHSAFEWQSIIRASIINIQRGGVVQGGSTITQQLAKKAFLTDERIFSRKIKELFLAIQLERRFTKDEILDAYLNQIPYGSNAYGIETASQYFFEKSARDITLSEAAIIASIPKAPTYYSPWGSHVEELLSRRDIVLKKMHTLGFITEEERDEALAVIPAFASPTTGIKAPHFVIMVQEYLNDRYGEDFIRTAGLTVITTLDWDLQQLAEKVVKEGAERNEALYKGTNAALVAEDAQTGQLVALVGSRDYFDTEREGNFNVASQGFRQPGSAIKPFAYTAAFKRGYTPDTIIFDTETEFDTTKDPLKSYMPHNYDGIFRGPVTLREALAQSINVPAVKVLYLAGVDSVLELARSFGLSTLTEKARYGLSLVLGGGEVTLQDLVHGYSVFAEDGVRHKQSMILSISANDRILERYRDEQTRVIDAQYVRLTNSILSDVDARSGLFSSSLPLTVVPGYDTALKTGTTNDYRDAWTIGYTPDLVVGVWAGNNDNTPMIQQGGSILAAVPMWHAFMSEALLSRPSLSFPRPDTVIAQKPILRGEYIVQFQSNGVLSPQIHSILFYVNKKDPSGNRPKDPAIDAQFENWEKPVLEWASRNVLNFTLFNQPLAPNSVALFAGAYLATDPIVIAITEPLPGSFIKSPVQIHADISSVSDINFIKLFFNNVLIDTRSGNLGTSFSYTHSFIASSPALQNLLSIEVTAEAITKKKEVILFK